MITTENINDITGAKLIDSDGDNVGTIGQVYVNEENGQPLFATVKTGLFGSNESFVPLRDANFQDGAVHVSYDKAKIKDAPHIADDGQLEADEQQRIFDYYDGATDSGSRDNLAETKDTTEHPYTSDQLGNDERTREDHPYSSDQEVAGQDLGYVDHDADTVGRDTSGPTTDDAMTRSEEQLHVGTEQVATDRVRLRKHIVTEQQSVNVPVSHEEVRLEREPITEANVGDALDGPELSEEEHEVVLTEERPVVQKETVPVERVSLGTETHTEQRTVSEDVSHEEIEVEGGDTGAGRTL
jgi:uncharacterized protein (TIGR02271 family)